MKELEKEINNFHSRARIGNFSDCEICPRNPNHTKTVYAQTCTKHFEINRKGLLIIMRDPGGEGAAKTEKLCPICNPDKSASKFIDIFNQFEIPHSHIQFCNSVLHGFYGKNQTPKRCEIQCCKNVVDNLFKILSPKIIFALGVEALETSFKILSNGKSIKASMKLWVENNFYFGSFNSTHLFSMPHISYCSLNLRNFGFSSKEVDDVYIKVPKAINKAFRKI